MVDIFHLSEYLRSEEAALRFLQRRNIIASTKLCARGHEMKIRLNKIKPSKWYCCKRTCRKEVGLLCGTWLENCRLPLRKVILFIYSWAYEYTTVKFCHKELGLSSHSIVDWKNKIREVCANDLLSKPMMIGGEGLCVEIDESCFSRRKYNVGRIYPQQWVFGGVCRETRECFLYSVPCRNAEMLTSCIKAAIRPGTTIYSDCWKAYKGLRKIPGMKYKHYVVNHSKNFVDVSTGAHTQRIESLWASVKRRNKRECGTRRDMLESYLCEFVWRRRYEKECFFEKILENIAEFCPQI